MLGGQRFKFSHVAFPYWEQDPSFVVLRIRPGWFGFQTTTGTVGKPWQQPDNRGHGQDFNPECHALADVHPIM